MTDQRDPGWYWVKIYDADDSWIPAELRPSQYTEGFVWHWGDASCSENFPRAIGPRIEPPKGDE